MDKGQNGSRNEASATAKVQVKSAPGIYLTPEQVALLGQAFPKEETILVKEEFRSGYSGAVVVLVSVGVGRAPLVVKMADPHDLQREYEAYEEYVRQVSPQNIAHLQGKPLVAPDGNLGLLQYTFAGGESHLPTTSLQTYFETAGAEETSAVLNRIFRVYGRHWWGNNRAQTYVLGEYYDRMLPVHLQSLRVDDAARADHVITSGESGILAVAKVAMGQIVQLVGYQVVKVRSDSKTMTLMGQAPSSEASAPIRVRVEMEQPADYRPGDIMDSIVVKVTATRQTLLGAAARAALPGFDPQAPQFTLTTAAEGGGVVLPNPLVKLQQQLYQVVETKTSIIHGDLNLQNVLVDGPTGFAWLIDFAETRVGPTLLDLQRLEVQAITKLLPASGDIPLGAVVEMMTRLHADPPLPAPPQPQLREPYALLVTIRRLARQYLIDDLDWNEYYYGLVVVLVGALKYDELDSNARRLALVCASAAQSLIGQPLQQVSAVAIAAAAAAEDIAQAAAASVIAAGAAAEPRRQAAETPVRATPASPLAQKSARPAANAAGAPARPAAGGRTPAAGKDGRRWAGLAIAAVAVLLIAAGGWWIASLSKSPESPSSGGPGQASVTEVASAAMAASPAADQTEVAGQSEEPAAAASTSASDTQTPDPTATSISVVAVATSPAGDAGQGEDSTAEGAATAVTPLPSPLATQASATETPAATGDAGDTATLALLASVNVRSGPGASYPIVGTLRIGTVVEPLGRSGTGSDIWYQIENPEQDDDLVWISGNAQLVDASGVADVPLITPVADAPAPAVVAPATIAPAGQIYYSATDSSGADNIYRVPAAGDAKPTLVAGSARQPAQAPNGQRLAFKSLADSALGIVGYDEASQSRVVYSGSPEDAAPSWNPSGDRIVFASNREGDRDWRLYVTWPESGGAFYQLGRGADPDWHPSQDLVVFRGCDDFGARCGLWTMATDGTGRQPLTNNPSDSRPRWSPNGQAIVFMSTERNGNWELYQVAAVGGEVTRLTNDPANDGLPAISPGGQRVAFMSNRGGSWGIWSMPTNGGAAQLVTELDTPMPNWLAQGLSWTR